MTLPTNWAAGLAVTAAYLNALDAYVNGLVNGPVTLGNPTINGYTEGVLATGVVTTSYTLSITSATVITSTLTASTACTFTMPAAAAGKAFVHYLKQPSTTGNGSATYTGVKWPSGVAPTVTPGAGQMDIFSFCSDGTDWFGSYSQGYTY
jgi:hypothetical protein